MTPKSRDLPVALVLMPYEDYCEMRGEEPKPEFLSRTVQIKNGEATLVEYSHIGLLNWSPAYCGEPLIDDRGNPIHGVIAYDLCSLPSNLADAEKEGWCPKCIAELKHETRYTAVSDHFLTLCRTLDVPIPKISPSLPTDPCDFTDHETVRINVKAAGDIPSEWHAAHVLGHYLCCLHAEADEREGGAGMTDVVADAIARMATAPRGRP